MDTYKLSNIIKRHMVHDKWNRFKNIKKQKLSFSFLRELCEKYYVSEWTEFEHCCMGEDHNCWIEVHSSWMKHGKKWTDNEYNREVYVRIKDVINSHFNKKQIGRRSIFIADGKNSIIVCIPMRDTIRKSDHWLVFDKAHPIIESKQTKNS